MAIRSKKLSKTGATILPCDVIVTTCSSRKNIEPARTGVPSSLSRGTQRAVWTEWTTKLTKLPRITAPRALYAGRGFGFATEATKMSGAKLYVLSAGLGIVPTDRAIPVYGLTVSSGHQESIARKINGEFDPAAWFEALLDSAYSDTWKDVAGRKSGRVLVALSRPYALMVGGSLSKIPPKMFSRLRVFGASLERALPSCLHPAIAPYDERLNAILPGTRSEFAQRAMLHFACSIAIQPSNGRDDDFAAVRSALKNIKSPQAIQRPRLTDEEILAIIRKRLRMQLGAGKMLAALRHEEGVACEQSRFGRLYRIAAGRSAVI